MELGSIARFSDATPDAEAQIAAFDLPGEAIRPGLVKGRQIPLVHGNKSNHTGIFP